MGNNGNGSNGVRGAVLYCRVSSESQVERNAANLPTQIKKCEDYCRRERLAVLNVFTDEAESGRTADRPALQEMLNYCRQHRGNVTHVIVADLSRLSRDSGDQATLMAGFRKTGVRLVSVDEPNIDDTAAGKLCANLLGAVNQFYSDSLSERVQYRMREAMKAGRFLNRAPLGYQNVRRSGTKCIVPDPERAPLISKAFEMMATGSYSSDYVLRTVTALGLRTMAGRPLPKQSFAKILRNPLYSGWVISAAGDLKARGIHQPLTTDEFFNTVQDVLAGRRARTPHQHENEDFPLRGFVSCHKCGKPLTAGHAKGRSRTYARYWCWTKGCGGVGISKAELEGHFVGLLGCMQPTAELIAQLPNIARSQWEQRKERISEERRVLNTRLNDQKALNQKAITAFLNGALSEEDLQAVKSNVLEQMNLIGEQLKSLTAEEKTLEALMEDAKQQVMNLAGTWQKAGLNQRKELQLSVFPDGLRFSLEKLFFEPGNHSLISEVKSFVDKLVSGSWPSAVVETSGEPVQDGCGGLQPSERTPYSLLLYYPAEPYQAA